jgi:hypothetical protein
MEKKEIPQFLAPFLWSSNLVELDITRDKIRIITNILNWGSQQAVEWLFATYTKDEISELVKYPRNGEWGKKSLNYWSLYFKVTPVMTTRFV